MQNAVLLTASLSGAILLPLSNFQHIQRTLPSQVVELKKIGATSANNSAQDRFRVVISDGQHNCQAMLATQQNQLVFDNQVRRPPVGADSVGFTADPWRLTRMHSWKNTRSLKCKSVSATSFRIERS